MYLHHSGSEEVIAFFWEYPVAVCYIEITVKNVG
jgi:hypothetical protein